MEEKAKRSLICVSASVSHQALYAYNSEFYFSCPDIAFRRLAEEVVKQAGHDTPIVAAAYRCQPTYSLCLVAVHKADTRELDDLQRRLGSLDHYCKKIINITYSQVETATDLLATKLIDRFGRKELKSFSFFPVPRGGLICLGFLSYCLNLTYKNIVHLIEADHKNSKPIVLVDDCSMSGHRLLEFAQRFKGKNTIGAVLYAPKELQDGFKNNSIKSIDCFVGEYLQPSNDVDMLPIKGEVLASKMSLKDRVLAGDFRLPCFPWGEADQTIIDAKMQKPISGWALTRPKTSGDNPNVDRSGGHQRQFDFGKCINRTCDLQNAIELPRSEKLNPDYMFFECGESLVAHDVVTKTSLELNSTGLDMLSAYLEIGSICDTVTELQTRFHVDREMLREDLTRVLNNFEKHRLLVA